MTSRLVLLITSIITMFYAAMRYKLTGKSTALIFSSVLALLFVFVTVCLIAYYRKGDRSRAGKGFTTGS